MENTTKTPISYDIKQVRNIIETVSRVMGVKTDIILSDTRRQPAALARQICMAIGYRTTYMSLAKVGECFRRDHGTVIHAMKAVDKACEKKSNADLVRTILNQLP